MRLPVAWKTALAIAAAAPTMPSAHRLAAERAGVEVRLANGDNPDVGHVGVYGHDVIGQVVVDDLAVAPVHMSAFEQRHAEPMIMPPIH